MKSYTSEHSFYCLQCGNKGIPLMRKVAKKKEPFHRKRLYCFHCKTEINHIECKNDWEVKEFKENFMKGVYVNEAQASVSFIRSGGMR
jgi:hypothetical protein